MRAQAEPIDQRLDLGAHLAVAGEHQLERPAGGDDALGRFDQQQLALLLAQAADAHQPRRRLGPGRRAAMEGLLEAAVHDLDLGPVGGRQPAQQLAATERADGDDEGRAPALLAEAERAGAVELLGAVDGEAVRRAAELARQHRHLGRIGAEVRMQVIDPGGIGPLHQAAGFGQVGEVMEQRAVRPAPHRRRQPERPGEAERPRRRHRQRRAEHAAEAVLQQVAGALALGAVGGIRAMSSPQPRTAKRSTATPWRSSARISRRMKLWLTFGYWLTR